MAVVAVVEDEAPRWLSSTWRWFEASPDEAALLAITRTSRTADGVAFEFFNDLYRADRSCVTFRTKAEQADHPGGRG